jgi:membrane protease YdiL (CAAX protease family)
MPFKRSKNIEYKPEPYAEDIKDNSRRVWPFAVPFVLLLLFTVGQLLALLPAKYVFNVPREAIETYPNVLHIIIGSFGFVLLLFILWVKFFERRSLASVGMITSKGAPFKYLRGFILGLTAAGAVVASIYMLGGYEVEKAVSLSMSDLFPIFLLMFSFMLQSGVEEVIFRGWMQSRLQARYGVLIAVLANSVLFTVMHLPSANDSSVFTFMIFAVNVFLFSIILSLYALQEKSIWGVAAAHASWNWMYITWFGLPTTGIELGLKPLLVDLQVKSGSADWLTGASVGPENSIMVTLTFCFAVLILWKIRRQNKEI